MKHHFYQYNNSGTLSPELLKHMEAIQDHARNVFAGQSRTFPPPLPEDPDLARACIEEWYATLDDLICADSTTVVGLSPSQAGVAPSSAARFAFRVRKGVLSLAATYPWTARETPVFRSGGESTDDRAQKSAIIYSDIIALGHAYALVELRGSDLDLRLNISGGGKNETKIYISLYTNGRLVEKSLLGTEVSWDLSSSDPGLYQLELGNKSALSFQIQE